jgi:hypothetical protein
MYAMVRHGRCRDASLFGLPDNSLAWGPLGRLAQSREQHALPIVLSQPENQRSFSDFDPSLATTAFTFDGYKVVKNDGIVCGIIVRPGPCSVRLARVYKRWSGATSPYLQSLRGDTAARLRPHDRTRCRDGRQCGYRRPLRRHASDAGRYRSALLRYCVRVQPL